MAKRKLRPKAARESDKVTAKKVNSGPKASEEFGGEIYASDDWKTLKKKHPGGFQTILLDLEKKEWDDGRTWYAVLEGHDKLAKISTPCGRVLREAFGDPMNDWKGRTVHLTPMKYNVGWGVVIDPILEDEEEELEELNDDDPNLDDDDDESVD